MKKRVFLIHLTIIVLAIGLFSYIFLGLDQLYKRNIFLGNANDLSKKEFKSAKVEYGFVIKKIGFLGSELLHNSEEQFAAASLIKLPILAAVFYAIEEEKVALDDLITIQRKDITGGSGKIKALSLPRKFTFAQLLELMIASSDNTATNKVIEILNFKYINDIFKRIGLKGTTLTRKMMDFSQRSKGIENYTSSSDIAYILEKIYKKQLINRELSNLALSFLKKQKVNDRLPRYLPEGIVIAHKTGLERGVVHDAGIVFTPKGDYIICVLVKGCRSYSKAKKFIAQFSLLTYNLMNDKR
ncbi:MAG: serine hydrolase [Candidatus Susulua stagnicola]|nr:serine hydrolase [Candidatus Susulua stagnicola]